MDDLRNAFLHKSGTQIVTFTDDTEIFAKFEDDVMRILNIPSITDKIEPTKQLNSFALLQIKPFLQKVARELVLKIEIDVTQLMELLGQTRLLTKIQLEELLDLGFIGKFHNGEDYVYFL